MTEVLLSIANQEARSDVDSLALADLILLGGLRAPLGEKVMSAIEVPISSVASTKLHLEPGRYLLSTTLPTGLLLQQDFEVPERDTSRVVIKPKPLVITPSLPAKRERQPRPPKIASIDVVSNDSAPSEPLSEDIFTRSDADERPLAAPRGVLRPVIVEEFDFGSLAPQMREVVRAQEPTNPRLSAQRVRRDLESLGRYRRRSDLWVDLPRPDLFDLSARNWAWRSPLVNDFDFVDQSEWVRQVCKTVRAVQSRARQVDTGHVTLRNVPDPGASAVFDGPDELARVMDLRGQRYVCALGAGAEKMSMAVVPTRWAAEPYSVASAASAAAEVELQRSDTGQWAMRITPPEPRFASLLGYLTIGDVVRARHLVSDSLEYLMAKVTNPFAAAAGGLVLMYSDDEDINHREWPLWIRNLAAWFPSLPDAQILLATLHLQRTWLAERCGLGGGSRVDRLTRVRRLTERAMRAGIPLYSLSMRLLVDNLEILRSEELRLGYERDTDEMPLDRALACVQAWSSRLVTVQPFTVLELHVNM